MYNVINAKYKVAHTSWRFLSSCSDIARIHNDNTEVIVVSKLLKIWSNMLCLFILKFMLSWEKYAPNVQNIGRVILAMYLSGG